MKRVCLKVKLERLVIELELTLDRNIKLKKLFRKRMNREMMTNTKILNNKLSYNSSFLVI
jgi:hypothetical protein